MGELMIETIISATFIQEKLIPYCIEFRESFVALKSAKIESKLDAAVAQTSTDQLWRLLNVDRWLECISLCQAQKL